MWRPAVVQHVRLCAASASSSSREAGSTGFVPAGFDWRKLQPTFDRYVEFCFQPEDLERFHRERELFRADPRLDPRSIRVPEDPGEMDWPSTFNALISILQADDRVTGPFAAFIHPRLEDKELMARFGISLLEGKTLEKPLHNTKSMPRPGSYHKILQQTYWLSLHTWLVHAKQHDIQETESVFGSAVCSMITRRTFEWSWIILRLWLMTEDVPSMNVQSEMEHFMEYVFGLCNALDEAWKQEAPNGTAAALALREEDLPEGCIGLVPLVKHVLWSNIYNGSIPHDSQKLHELAVYLVRQRLALDAFPRNSFLMAKELAWADFPEPSE